MTTRTKALSTFAEYASYLQSLYKAKDGKRLLKMSRTLTNCAKQAAYREQKGHVLQLADAAKALATALYFKEAGDAEGAREWVNKCKDSLKPKKASRKRGVAPAQKGMKKAAKKGAKLKKRKKGPESQAALKRRMAKARAAKKTKAKKAKALPAPVQATEYTQGDLFKNPGRRRRVTKRPRANGRGDFSWFVVDTGAGNKIASYHEQKNEAKHAAKELKASGGVPAVVSADDLHYYTGAKRNPAPARSRAYRVGAGVKKTARRTHAAAKDALAGWRENPVKSCGLRDVERACRYAGTEVKLDTLTGTLSVKKPLNKRFAVVGCIEDQLGACVEHLLQQGARDGEVITLKVAR